MDVSVSIAVVSRPETTAQVTRGAARLLTALGYAPLAEVTRYFAAYNLVAVPVIDDNDRLLGTVTVDDVIDHMLPDNWREQDSDG